MEGGEQKNRHAGSRTLLSEMGDANCRVPDGATVQPQACSGRRTGPELLHVAEHVEQTSGTTVWPGACERRIDRAWPVRCAATRTVPRPQLRAAGKRQCRAAHAGAGRLQRARRQQMLRSAEVRKKIHVRIPAKPKSGGRVRRARRQRLRRVLLNDPTERLPAAAYTHRAPQPTTHHQTRLQ